MTNPTELIRELDPDAIRTRLGEIERERRALLVLLRAARRAQPKQPNTTDAEGQRPRCPTAGEESE